MEKYKKIEVIGYGSQNTKVYKVIEVLTNLVYAMKRISIDDNQQNIKEIEIMKEINHSNIIKLKEYFINKNSLYIVMEYAEGGDLSSFIKSKTLLSEEVLIKYIVQIADALSYLHLKKIIHRDIKPQNIFLSKDKKNVKLGDFGISKKLKNTLDLAETSTGTPFYLAPEICLGMKYSTKCDIWMFGCTFYELITLSKPFKGTNLIGIMKEIVSSEIDFTSTRIDFTRFSNKLIELIKKMLIKDALLRPIASDIMDCYNISEVCEIENNSKEERKDVKENKKSMRSKFFEEMSLKNKSKEKENLNQTKHQRIKSIISIYSNNSDGNKSNNTNQENKEFNSKSNMTLKHSQSISTYHTNNKIVEKQRRGSVIKYDKNNLVSNRNEDQKINIKNDINCLQSNRNIKDLFKIQICESKNKKHLVLNKEIISNMENDKKSVDDNHDLLNIISPLNLLYKGGFKRKISTCSLSSIKKEIVKDSKLPNMPMPKAPKTTKMRIEIERNEKDRNKWKGVFFGYEENLHSKIRVGLNNKEKENNNKSISMNRYSFENSIDN